MKRCNVFSSTPYHLSAYPFRRNERIIGFFDNFKDFMGEEEMWQISERLKPRGRRQVNY